MDSEFTWPSDLTMPSIPLTDIIDNPHIYFDTSVYNLASGISPTSRKDIFDLADQLADLSTKGQPFRFRGKDNILKGMKQRDAALKDRREAGEEIDMDSDAEGLRLATDDNQVVLDAALAEISAQALLAASAQAPGATSAGTTAHDPKVPPETGPTHTSTEGDGSKPEIDGIPATDEAHHENNKPSASTKNGRSGKRKRVDDADKDTTPSTQLANPLRRSNRDRGGVTSGASSSGAQPLQEPAPRPRKKKRTWCWQRPDGTITDTEPVDNDSL